MSKCKPVAVKYRKFRNGSPAIAMEFMPEWGERLKNEEMVYFFKFFNGAEILFNKIGTSKIDAISRLRDEIGDYAKNYQFTRVEIHRVRSCFGIPAEGYESMLRARLIANYPCAFRKNDRFFGVDIDPCVFDEICDGFCALCH